MCPYVSQLHSLCPDVPQSCLLSVQICLSLLLSVQMCLSYLLFVQMCLSPIYCLSRCAIYCLSRYTLIPFTVCPDMPFPFTVCPDVPQSYLLSVQICLNLIYCLPRCTPTPVLFVVHRCSQKCRSDVQTKCVDFTDFCKFGLKALETVCVSLISTEIFLLLVELTPMYYEYYRGGLLLLTGAQPSLGGTAGECFILLQCFYSCETLSVAIF